MRSLVWILWFASLGFGANAAVPPAQTRRSQQFIVQDMRNLSPVGGSFAPKAGLIPLDPDVLLFSAERIHQALSKELNLPPAGGKERIHLTLRRASDHNQNLAVASLLFPDGWHYRVDIPDQVEDIKLVRAIVQVLLQELANRGNALKSAEIPLWLSEGLSFQILSSAGPGLVPKAIQTGWMARTVRVVRGMDTLQETREFLRTHPPLSVTEMSHPNPAYLTGEPLQMFQQSARLLVGELSRLPNGKLCLVKMLRLLPVCWNWETAFLKAFEPRFERLLDVEKWWSVSAMAFTGRAPNQTWPSEVCLQRLDDILLTLAEVRLATNALPVRTRVTLQQVVSEWELELQRPVLRQVISQLTSLRFNCPLEIVPTVDRYRVTLQNYLDKRAESDAGSGSKRSLTVPARLLVQNTVKELDELYRQREALRRSRVTTADVPIRR
jgi:hypothetical protein